jgi:plasmid maintenance system antidote protein VapI
MRYYEKLFKSVSSKLRHMNTDFGGIMSKNNINMFSPAVRRAKVTTGEVIKMLRELKGWSQEELCKHSGINAKNISLLENNRVDIGKKRAEQLAKAFDIHPAVIMFPEYESDLILKAA